MHAPAKRPSTAAVAKEAGLGRSTLYLNRRLAARDDAVGHRVAHRS
jgi:hypothetical protein